MVHCAHQCNLPIESNHESKNRYIQVFTSYVLLHCSRGFRIQDQQNRLVSQCCFLRVLKKHIIILYQTNQHHSVSLTNLLPVIINISQTLPDPSHPHVTAFLLDIDQEQVGLWLHFDTSKVIYLLRKHNITSQLPNRSKQYNALLSCEYLFSPSQ